MDQLNTCTIKDLVLRYKESNDELYLSELLNRFQPIIYKYSKKIFYIEKEDCHQELKIAIYMAVKKTDILQCEYAYISYISRSVRYRFMELYHQSKKNQDESPLEKGIIENEEDLKSSVQLQNIDYYHDLNRNISRKTDIERKIVGLLLRGYSDKEIALSLKLSRQYINRAKKNIITNR